MSFMEVSVTSRFGRERKLQCVAAPVESDRTPGSLQAVAPGPRQVGL